MALIRVCHWTPHSTGLHSAAGVLGWRCVHSSAPQPALRAARHQGTHLRTPDPRARGSTRGPANPALETRPLQALGYARPRPSARVLCRRHFRCRGAVAVETAFGSTAGPRPSSAAHPVPSPRRCRCPEPCGRPTALGTGPAGKPVPRGCGAGAGSCRRRWGRFARPFNCPRLAPARRGGRARAGPEAFVPAWEP